MISLMNLLYIVVLFLAGCLIYIYNNHPSTRFRKIFGCSSKEDLVTSIPKVQKILEEKFKHHRKKWNNWEKFIESEPTEFEISDAYALYGDRGEDFMKLIEAVYIATHCSFTSDDDFPLSIDIPKLFRLLSSEK